MFFFFNDTATTEIYTLSLHDALPIFRSAPPAVSHCGARRPSTGRARPRATARDRKSTRLNSSHLVISYAVFCLKKKTIADSTSLPIIVYNVPPRTNVNIFPETIARLAEIQTIAGVKEASGDISHVFFF